jgi:hypothetical protein
MDSERFGRALGIGARVAAKTLVTAVDAATSPNPSEAKAGVAKDSAAARLGQVAVETVSQVKETGQGLKSGGRLFGKEFGGRVAKLSGVLWLEFTGVFFGLFAVFAVGGMWRLRGNLFETAGNHDAHVHFLMAAVMAVVFGYFCVSSFVRASRRGRAR